jgi:hypothetical protein
VPNGRTNTNNPSHIFTPPSVPSVSPQPTPDVPSPQPTRAGNGATSDAAAPILNTAPPAEGVLTLPGGGGVASSSSSAGAGGASAGGPSTSGAAAADGSTRLDLASSSTNALGVNDNLLLAAMIAVFAVLVFVLVSAGGRRGSWREH